jgi:hypothetical protein
MTQTTPEKYRAAISPNIFDAYADTNFLLPLVLGNLLSKKLWDFSLKIQAKLKTNTNEQSSSAPFAEDPLWQIRAIQKQLDRHFKHLNAGVVSNTFGELSLVDERQRLGAHFVDEAVDRIKQTFLLRLRERTLPAEAVDSLMNQIEHERFPAYFYKNFDVVLANSHLTGRGSSAPLGVTSCLDEIAIFAALVMTIPEVNVERIISLASAAHYSAFGWTNQGEAWWLYGKNKLMSKAEWQALVDQQYDGNAQAAFDYFLGDMDRIICSSGLFDLKSGRTEIPDALTNEIVHQLDCFFGLRLSQLTSALALPVVRINESPLMPVLRELLHTHSFEQTRKRLLTEQTPDILPALYSYRSLAVPDILPYLETARRQPIAKARAREMTSYLEVIAMIRQIEGVESIFGDRDRIAMPDETLALRTGTDRDKALLAHVMLEHVARSQPDHGQILTILTITDSYVSGNGFCLSLKKLSEAHLPTDNVLWQLSS